MRTPTTSRNLYAWHSAALAGEDPPVHDGEPQCGWFKTRLVKRGPFVPARIWMFQPTDDDGCLCGDEQMQCEINGQYADPVVAWTSLCKIPITEAEFKYMTASITWARENAPDEPSANPNQPVDWSKVPTPTF